MSRDVNTSLGQRMSNGVVASLLINGNFVVPKDAGRLNRRGYFQYLPGCILKAAAQNDFRFDASFGQLLADDVQTSQDKGDFPRCNSMNLPLLGSEQEQCRHVAGLGSRKQRRIVQNTQICTKPNKVLGHDQIPIGSDVRVRFQNAIRPSPCRETGWLATVLSSAGRKQR